MSEQLRSNPIEFKYNTRFTIKNADLGKYPNRRIIVLLYFVSVSDNDTGHKNICGGRKTALSSTRALLAVILLSQMKKSSSV